MKNIKEVKGILEQVQKILESVYDADLEYHGLESLEDMIADAIFLLDKEVVDYIESGKLSERRV